MGERRTDWFAAVPGRVVLGVVVVVGDEVPVGVSASVDLEVGCEIWREVERGLGRGHVLGHG